MLVELRIANFALIEQLHLEFQPGFTVLTGETGAGKSLLIDAIGLLVGGRASADQIRTGEEETLIEASFLLPASHPLLQQLRSHDVIGPQDREIVLKRILSRSGRNRMYLNGSLCPVRVLEQLGGTLVDIHGQHEQQSLLSSARQLDAVDGFGGLLDLRRRYEEAYRGWRELHAILEVTRQERGSRERMVEVLQFQFQEIDRAGLSIAEEESLQAEKQRLLHAHRLRELALAVYTDLEGDDQGVLGRLGRTSRLLAELAQTDQSMADCRPLVQDVVVQLKDLARRLRDYSGHLETDSERQSQVEDRLDLIQRLKKKYGGSVEGVLDTLKKVKEELSAVENRESTLSELVDQVTAAENSAVDLAMQLSRKRHEAADRLTRLVAEELSAVRMESATFRVTVTGENGPGGLGASGLDRVDFLLSSNLGEPPRPLARIASGGELSRVMLALKTVLAETDRVPVLVFDEIDAGVGGEAASAVGVRLRRLGSFHQVFCITHLPQVASHGEHHLLVEKGEDGRRTMTSVRPLKGARREAEIARMIGGQTITKKVRETAAELIAEANGKQ